MMNNKIMNDIEIARKTLEKTDCSIVVIKNKKILFTEKGDGITPIIKTINHLNKDMIGTIIGDRILGKASALLCRYAQVKAVYSPQATKTAIATLIIGRIPCQIDEIIPNIRNRQGNDICPFEKILTNIDSPEKAYNLLKEKNKI